MTIGQEQLMKMRGKAEKVGGESRWRWTNGGWKIIEVAFNLWLAAVVGICAWIAIFG